MMQRLRHRAGVGLVALGVMVVAAAGCVEDDDPLTLADHGFTASGRADGTLAADNLDWPDFAGRTLDILDHGAFDFAFPDAAARFEELTGARVTHWAESDTGSALNRAIVEKGRPTFDILYGVDNALMARAIDAGIFAPYTPRLADRVPASLVFFADATEGPADGALAEAAPWPATPVDYGFIALNVDADGPGLDDVTPIEDLFDVRGHADTFVTQDPRTSTPGLGFLLITIAVFGESGLYTWNEYWNDLFAGGVLVTGGWSDAYATHFSGGYGMFETGFAGDRAIVTSYTESPAAEVYFESYGPEERADVLLTHGGSPAVFRQVQTMGILAGTPDLDVAQAWIEFTLTDDFQGLAAPASAVYPVVPIIDHNATYGALDPEPGTFATIDLGWQTIGAHLARWLDEWTDLCEAHRCR
jgi:thiamine transport system substrate-binding protein